MGGGPEAGQLCEPLRLRRVRRNEAGPEGGTVDIARGAIFGNAGSGGPYAVFAASFGRLEGQCPSAGNDADGCFSIIVKRKDDFDFDPVGFHWSIMENRSPGLAGLDLELLPKPSEWWISTSSPMCRLIRRMGQ